MGRLTDKVAIITGARSGIGRGIAEAFAAEGATLVLTARTKDKLETAAQEIAKGGNRVKAIVADVTDEKQVAELFRQTVEAFGRVDILVNNAGTNTRYATVDLPLSEWKRVIETNLTGPFICGREALRLMSKQKSGRIINIASISAKRPRPNAAAYVSSKFGLEGLTRSMALDGRPDNVAVCCIYPGNTWSELKIGREEQQHREGIMEAADIGAMAVAIAALPDGVNMLECEMLPVKQPFIGRG